MWAKDDPDDEIWILLYLRLSGEAVCLLMWKYSPKTFTHVPYRAEIDFDKCWSNSSGSASESKYKSLENEHFLLCIQYIIIVYICLKTL